MTQPIVQSRKNRPNKYQSSYSFYELYSYFSKFHGGKKKHGVSRTVYSKVLNEFTRFIGDELVEGKIFYFPFGLGSLGIQEITSGKTFLNKYGNLSKKYLREDWSSTLKWWKESPENHGKVLYYENKHTDGKRYRTVWDKTTVFVKGAKYYRFVVCRRISRQLAQKLKDPEFHRNYSKKH